VLRLCTAFGSLAASRNSFSASPAACSTQRPDLQLTCESLKCVGGLTRGSAAITQHMSSRYTNMKLIESMPSLGIP
jgi:hypothetical protein